MSRRSSDLLWTVMSWIVNDGATWSEVKLKLRRAF